MSKAPAIKRFADDKSELVKFADIEFNRNSVKIKRKLRKILHWCAKWRHMTEFGHPAELIKEVFGSNSKDILSTSLTKCFLLRTNKHYSTGTDNCAAFTCRYSLVEREINEAHNFIYSWSLNEAIKLVEEKRKQGHQRALATAYVDNNRDKANHPFYKLLSMPKFQALEVIDRDLIISYFTKYYDELSGAKPFEYTDKSSRLWHGIQNISSEGKDCLFEVFGLKHNYDLEAAAATLITEFSLTSGYIEETRIPVVLDYIADRKLFRKTLAEKYDISEDQAKSVFACLVNRAPINPVYDTCGYSRIFANTVDGHQKALKISKDRYVIKFKREMKMIWKAALIAVNAAAFRNNSPLGEIKNNQRFLLYFKQERKMLDLMRNYLDKIGARYFLEHDGFRSDKEINLDEILTYMKEQTGYTRIKIS